MTESDFWTFPRIASGLWAAATISAATWFEGSRGFFAAIAMCALPVTCIWIGEPLTHARDSRWFGRRIVPPIAGPTPGFMYSLVGWIMLVAFTVVLWRSLIGK